MGESYDGIRVLVDLICIVKIPNRLLKVQPQVNEDVGHVVLQGRCQPPALLSELGVMCHCVLHLLLLRAKGVDAVQEIGDAPENRVLVVEAC